MSLAEGTRLGRYQIRSRIGAGGMGEVYLADDTLLKRPAAIKVLAVDYTQNEERLQRFEREASTASSLNHPNIITIYEIGSEAGCHFIATEYVEGESLRQHSLLAEMDLRDVVDIAIQIASALAAAHEAGIVHRDIKPENVMVRRDGYIKVLDFGLAKLALEVETSRANTEASTQVFLKTEPGRVMGTINYMSPEQARGQAVDARTDIFSLGVVLYEMVAGQRPFSGDTKSDVLAAVLMVEPQPLADKCPQVPAEFNRIVNKALKKNREERYQSTKELLLDLKSLRHELEIAAKAGQGILRVPAIQRRLTTTDGLAPASTARQAEGGPTISELFINEVKAHPRRATVTLSIIFILLAVGGIGLYRLIKLTQQPESFQSMRMTKVTSAGNVLDEQVAISPDGKYVVYASQEAGQQSLWIRQVATSSDVQLVGPRAAGYHGLRFSPDGNYVYYVVVEKQGIGVLYQIPSLGGSPRKLIEDADGPVTLPPDGSRIAFVRDNRLLMVANSDGTSARTLATASTGTAYERPAWSPDGQTIVCSRYSSSDNSRLLVQISVKDGRENLVASPGWLSLPGISWLQDGSGLLVTARDFETKLLQVWLVTYPEGKLRRITNDLSSYIGISLTQDGKTLASVQSERLSNIWTMPAGNVAAARRLTFGKDDGYAGMTTSGSRIVYDSRMSGLWNLWIVNEDGTNNHQLTFNARDSRAPCVTSNGRHIVFVSNRSGKYELWKMDVDGGNPRQLTDSQGIAGLPNCSPDGKSVVYQVSEGSKATIWKVGIEGGAPVQLTTEDSGRPVVSPDSKLFACEYGEASGHAGSKLALVSIDGGPPAKILDLPSVVRSPVYRWLPDGRSLVYIDSVNRVYNLWSQSLDSGPPKQLTDFSSDQIFRFDLTPDGKKIVLSRGREGSDVVLITNFR
jgi:eukaryotic-like serine/threonine-protein kinase